MGELSSHLAIKVIKIKFDQIHKYIRFKNMEKVTISVNFRGTQHYEMMSMIHYKGTE